jgi:hypothetical protein
MKIRDIQKAVVNVAKLVEELTPIGLEGVNIGVDNGAVRLVCNDNVSNERIDALAAGVLAHDHTAQTSKQVTDAQERADVAALIGQIDTAIADIASKRATLQATPNLANATALLNELAQDVTGMLKAMKRVLKQVT